jgi:hypothetical protein
MKIPSLSKLPKHKRFNIEPRYYDPVREDVENRISRIRSEMNISEKTDNYFGSKLSGAFERRRTQAQQSNILQMIIFLFLSAIVVGYLFFGNNVVYLFLILMPVYFYFRFKRKSQED